jgi:hypothetical protein
MPTMKPSIMSSLAVLALAATLSFPVSGEPADSAELDRLRDRVSDLEARIERLEAGLADTDAELEAAKPPEVVPGGWRKAANWRVLEKGLEGWRVREILGEPGDTWRVSKFEYYAYGEGGLVRFYLGRVKSWEVPAGLDAE